MGLDQYITSETKRQKLVLGPDGWVYVLTNPAMPGLVKIGCTKRSPDIRAAELTAATGVPAAFTVAWAAPVTDYRRVEVLAHTRLNNWRSNRNREFFRCDVDTARKNIEGVAAALLRPWWWKLLHPGALPRRRSRRRRAAHTTEAVLVAVVIALVLAGVGWLKPALPAWLPASVFHVLAMIERLT